LKDPILFSPKAGFFNTVKNNDGLLANHIAAEKTSYEYVSAIQYEVLN
jgi:hypothetical protein